MRIESLEVEQPKLCIKCFLAVPEDGFAFQNKAAGRRDTICRKCKKAYLAEHYIKNKQVYLQRSRQQMPGTQEHFRAWLRAYKDSRSCVDCGGKFHFSAMEFDHTRSDKVANVSRIGSIARAKTEIIKCDLVCANCHRVRTYTRMIAKRQN